MGLYAEPQDRSVAGKYRWFKEHGNPFLGTPTFQDAGKDQLPVCFLNNGAFAGLAVAWDEREFKRLRFGRPDGVWVLVAKADLCPVVAGGARMKELK